MSPQTERHSRRKRRSHRRDVKRGYLAPITTNPKAARHGVRSRLGYAVLAGLAMLACGFALMFVTQGAYATTACALLAFCFFNAMIAMVMSARREETVHRLATQPEVALLDSQGFDGDLGRLQGPLELKSPQVD